MDVHHVALTDRANPTHQLDKVAKCAVEAADALISRLNMPKGSP